MYDGDVGAIDSSRASFRAIFVEVDPGFWARVISTLSQYRVHAVYCISPTRRHDSGAASPGQGNASVPIHNRFDAMRLENGPLDGRFRPKALSQTERNALAPDILSAVGVLNRIDLTGRKFSSASRLDFVDRQFGYWNGLLDHIDPDLIVWQEQPGLVSEFLLQALCKLRRTKNLFFHQTHLAGFIRPSSSMLPTPPGTESNGLIHSPRLTADMLALTKRHLTGLAGPAEDAAGFSKVQFPWVVDLEVDRRTSRVLNRVRSLGGRSLAGVLDRVAFPTNSYVMPRHSHCPKRSNRLLVASMGGWDAVRRRILQFRYRQFAVPLSAVRGLKFVYFPLHLQPEISTEPLGGFFGNQLNALRFTSEALPKGWLIAVKEHPATFNSGNWGSIGRTESYYRRILAIPNTILIRENVPSQTLIDLSEAVVTVTGTAAWEAVARSRRSYYFGYPWYSGAPGTRRIEDVLGFSSSLRSRNPDEQTDSLMKYCQRLLQESVPAYVNRTYARRVPFGVEANDWTLSQSILRVLHHRED